MKKCDCYHLQPTTRYTYNPLTGRPIGHDIEVGVCWGTKECDECSCGGDQTKCDFYPEVREQAKKKLQKNKVIVERNFYGETFYCPSCRRHLGSDYDDFRDMNYCQKCGQKLEWE